jgi:hypothetical protein
MVFNRFSLSPFHFLDESLPVVSSLKVRNQISTELFWRAKGCKLNTFGFPGADIFDGALGQHEGRNHFPDSLCGVPCAV